MTPDAFVEFFKQSCASAILRTPFADAAGPAMDAAIDAGFKVVEFTLTTPGAFDLISQFSSRDGVVVGAGTVITTEDANKALDAGAKFLVSPVVDEAVIDVATSRGAAMMPGTHTPTEMLRAHRAGAQLQKLFPAPGIGAAFVKACLGPLPFLNIVPTAGVDEHNVKDYFAAGAHAVGFVAPLFDPAMMEARDFKSIEQRAMTLLAAAQAARI